MLSPWCCDLISDYLYMSSDRLSFFFFCRNLAHGGKIKQHLIPTYCRNCHPSSVSDLIVIGIGTPLLFC